MRTFFLILVTLIILAVALTSQYLLLERLFILAAALLFFCFLIAVLGIRGIKGRLTQPLPYLQAGKASIAEGIIENKSALPKPFLSLKINTNTGDRSNLATMTNLNSRSVFNWYSSITFPRRGKYQIGPLIAESTDPFGLFRLRKKLDSVQDVLIYPAILELPFFFLSSVKYPGSFHYGRELAQSGSLISGVRDYVLGDSLNRIHWRSTAHRRKLVVKEYDAEIDEKIWLFLDLNKNYLYGSGIETTEEYGITIAASVLKKFSDEGQQVGLVAQGAQYYYYPPRNGSADALRILGSMSLMKAEGQIPLSRLISRIKTQLNQNSTVIIITACLEEDLTETIIRTKRMGIKVITIFLDELSFGGRHSANQKVSLLRSQDIPTYLIEKGANLAASLNNKASLN